MNYRKKVVLLISLFTLLRVIIATGSELSNAEVYYWSYALRLQLNYYDHPPAVAWLIRLTTINLLLHAEIFVRIGAVISAAVCTWLIFIIGTLIHSARTGWLGALLYTSSLYAGIIAGAYILPDTPEMIFWLLAIYLLVRIAHLPLNDKRMKRLWYLFGCIAGLCIMSKVHGIFLWAGVIIYAAIVDRSWWLQRSMYLAAILTLVIASPILAWNIHNGFVTYYAYSNRISLAGMQLHLATFVKSLISIVGITNPVNCVLIVISIWWFITGKGALWRKDIQLILCCTLPLTGTLFFISLFREVLPHWPGPALSTLVLLPAVQLSADSKRKRRLIPVIILVGLFYMTAMAYAEFFVALYFPGTLSEKKEALNLGAGDPTLDHYGWNLVGVKFDSLYQSDNAKKLMPAETPIVIDKWFPAAHIEYYIASKTGQQVIAMGKLEDLGNYYFINKYKKAMNDGDCAYFIIPSNLFDYKAFDKVVDHFGQYELAMNIPVYRSGLLCKQYYVFRLKGFRS